MLLPSRLDGVPVRVVNPTDRAVWLKAGVKLANVEPADVVEAAQDTADVVVGAVSAQEPVHIQPLLDGVEAAMTPEQLTKFEDLFRAYSNVFSQGKRDLGRTTVVRHEIDTQGARPIRQPLRRQPLSWLSLMEKATLY